MCTQSQLSKILTRVDETPKRVFGGDLSAVYLYGSYARGDQDADSDVDIMVLADVPREYPSSYKRPFLELTSELGLENDIVITVTLKDTKTFNMYLDAVPFYQNVLKEGIKVAV
ncbi:MAG: nucleotidyltransferase domain-containing protein [Clostridia bacterium]|nr:nucleotidyltransferase domain-containing protein [Clostridia bacterium]